MAYFLKTGTAREERPVFWRGSNGNKGAIVGTATYTPQSSTDPIAAGSHGVLLFPLQLTLLNGSTPDFDGCVPTSWIPAPEFPNYDDCVAGTGVTNLGPLSVETTSGRLSSGFYNCLMVAAQAPANFPGIQFQWKRYWKMRQWYLNYSISTGEWTVTSRATVGTDPSLDGNPLGRDESVSPDDTAPSSTKHEFYAADSPGMGYGSASSDSQCHTGDYIENEATFVYKVQYSFDGTNWQDGTSLTIHHQITVQFKQNYTGDPSADLNVKANIVSNGDNDPTMTPTKAAFIVGSGHVNRDNANPTGC